MFDFSEILITTTEKGLNNGDEVVLMTTKGEAIAIGIMEMGSVELMTAEHGCVCKVKRCIMERDTYPRKWGLGPVAGEKKTLKAQGKLDKYGRKNESTPKVWNDTYVEYGQNGQQAITNGSNDVPVAEKTVKEDVLAAPAISPLDNEAASTDDIASKKRRFDEETAAGTAVLPASEEAERERKRLKREKKEKRKSEGKA